MKCSYCNTYIPQGLDVAKCLECGTEIKWLPLADDKNQSSYTPNGISLEKTKEQPPTAKRADASYYFLTVAVIMLVLVGGGCLFLLFGNQMARDVGEITGKWFSDRDRHFEEIAASKSQLRAEIAKTFSSPEIPVWVALGTHHMIGEDPKHAAELALQTVKVIDAEISAQKIPENQPITFWFENGLPPRLVGSFMMPDQFYYELAAALGMSPGEIKIALRESHLMTGEKKDKIQDAMKKIYDKAMSAMDLDVQRGMQANPRSAVFMEWIKYQRRTREVEYRAERPTFVGWTSLLSYLLWVEAEKREFAAANLDGAMKYAMNGLLTLKIHMISRDQQLAADIEAEHKKNPERLNIVERGALHELLSEFLKEKGIQSKQLYQTNIHDETVEGEAIINYRTQALTSREARDSEAQMRQIIIRSWIQQMLWALHPNLTADQAKKRVLTEKLEGLTSAQMQEWEKMIWLASKAADKTRLNFWGIAIISTQQWLIKKFPELSFLNDISLNQPSKT